MSGNTAINRIKDVLMPDYYFDYYNDISKNTFDFVLHAAAVSDYSVLNDFCCRQSFDF